MSGVAGGWLADRVFGSQRAVFYGGVLIMFGHVVLALRIGLAGVHFGVLGAIAIGLGALLLVFSPKIKELTRGVDWKSAEARRGGGAAGLRLMFRMPYDLGPWTFISLNEWVTSAFIDGE
jgi:POT family proton-dependent oligopeptide transporter